MNKKAYILVFSSGSLFQFDGPSVAASALDEGDKLFALDDNIVFLKTKRSLESLMEQLKASPIARVPFVLTEISGMASVGNMPARFWNYLSAPEEALRGIA